MHSHLRRAVSATMAVPCFLPLPAWASSSTGVKIGVTRSPRCLRCCPTPFSSSRPNRSRTRYRYHICSRKAEGTTPNRLIQEVGDAGGQPEDTAAKESRKKGRWKVIGGIGRKGREVEKVKEDV